MEIQKVIGCVACGSGNTDANVFNNGNGSFKVECNDCGYTWWNLPEILEPIKTITYTEDEVMELMAAFDIVIEFARQYHMPIPKLTELFDDHKKK